MTQEFGTAIFHRETQKFTVKTPKGVFEDVCNIGGFDNYREMDACVGTPYFEEICDKHGLLAYLFDSPKNQYLFYYPKHAGGGDIAVYYNP